MMGRRAIRLALIGCGRHGRSLGRTFLALPGVQIAAAADVVPEAAQTAAAEFGSRVLTVEQAIADAELDALLVATPNATHHEIVLAACRAGKHVYCEKPMALTVADCDSMIEAARARCVKLQVGHMQRFFPLLERVAERLRAGLIGRPLALGMCRRDFLLRSPGWLAQRRHVGGILFQSSVHEFDWLHAALGPIEQVFAQAAPAPVQQHLDFPDTVFVQLRFASESIGALEACMSDHLQAYGGTVNGAEGTLAFDLHSGELRWRRADGTAGTEQVPQGRLAETYAPASRRAAAEFIAWLQEDRPPSVTPGAARQAVAVACAAEAAIDSGRWEPVDGAGWQR